MSILHTQQVLGADNQIGSSVTISLSAPPARSFITGIVEWGTLLGQSISTVQDNTGANYNVSGTVNDAANNKSSAFFYLGNVSNSPTSITITFSASTTSRAALDVYSGIKPVSNPSDTGASQVQTLPGTGTDGAKSGNFSPSINGELIYGSIGLTGAGSTISAGTGFTIRNNSVFADVVQIATEDLVQVNKSATTNATFTLGTSVAAATHGISFFAEPDVINDASDTMPPATLISKKTRTMAIALIASGLTFVDPVPSIDGDVIVSNGPSISNTYIYQTHTEPVAITQVPSGEWMMPWTERQRLARRLTDAVQQTTAFTALPPTIQVAPVSINGPAFSKRFTYQSSAIVYTVAPIYSWLYQLSEPVRLKPQLSTALQTSALADPVPFTTAAFGWKYPFSEPVRQKPGLNTALQSDALRSPLPITAITGDYWFSPLSEPVKLKPRLPEPEQSFLAKNTYPPEFTSVDKWFSELARLPRALPALGASLQQEPAFPPFPLPQADVFGWHNSFSEPVRLKPQLNAALQQSTIFTAPIPNTKVIGTIFDGPVFPIDFIYQDLTHTDINIRGSSVDQWFVSLSEPVRTNPLLIPALQQPLSYSATATDLRVPPSYYTDPIFLPNRMVYEALAYVRGIPGPDIVTLDKWYAALSEPVRFPKALLNDLQAAYVGPIFVAYAGGPTWNVGPRFRREFQYQAYVSLPSPLAPWGGGPTSYIGPSFKVNFQYQARSAQPPIFVTPINLVMLAQEGPDSFSGLLLSYPTVNSAEVSIREIPRTQAYVSIIEPVKPLAYVTIKEKIKGAAFASVVVSS